MKHPHSSTSPQRFAASIRASTWLFSNKKKALTTMTWMSWTPTWTPAATRKPNRSQTTRTRPSLVIWSIRSNVTSSTPFASKKYAFTKTFGKGALPRILFAAFARTCSEITATSAWSTRPQASTPSSPPSQKLNLILSRKFAHGSPGLLCLAFMTNARFMRLKLISSPNKRLKFNPFNFLKNV